MLARSDYPGQQLAGINVVVVFPSHWLFLLCDTFLLSDIPCCVSAQGQVHTLASFRAGAHNVRSKGKNRCCWECQRQVLRTVFASGVVCLWDWRQCRSALSVCAQEKAGLICLRLCVGRRKSRCVVVFVLQLQITNNYNNLASIRVGSSAKPAIIQHVSFIFLSVSADAAWLKCVHRVGEKALVWVARACLSTRFSIIIWCIMYQQRGVASLVLFCEKHCNALYIR